MTDEANHWRDLASQLNVKVVAPAIVAIGADKITFTALLPQFGAENGMIVDPDWKTIRPHAEALLSLGFGFSAVSLSADGHIDGAIEMLRDWGWCSSDPAPQWLTPT